RNLAGCGDRSSHSRGCSGHRGPIAEMEPGERAVAGTGQHHQGCPRGRVSRTLWNKVIPGILDDFDCPRMLEAIAPRPLLILNGEKDPNNPLEGAKLAFAAAEDAYKQAKAADHLEIDVAPGVAHAVTPAQREKAYAWLEQWLKPAHQ